MGQELIKAKRWFVKVFARIMIDSDAKKEVFVLEGDTIMSYLE